MVNDAYAACLAIARAHYENFPVASRLVPASLRPHVAALYAFARGADDIADEPGRTPAERIELLDEWSAHLRQPPRTAVFEALGDTRARFNLPLHLFDDLLSAFKQDVHTTRYDSWDDVLDYCRRSANPIGRLVLRLAGVARGDADQWSDAVCTALQLTNFWQDFAIDWQRGRLYVPASVWRATGADPADLDARMMSPAWKACLRECAGVTRRHFDQGRAVCDVLPGRLRYELRGTWLGGIRILDKLETVDFEVFARRPTLTTSDAMMIGLRALTWRATHPSITHF
ncbi:MAG: squalene synthase HpnC [Planctomycetota bacterium]|nr:squalene synthase HpnC [Planctomycetota bacterium]